MSYTTLWGMTFVRTFLRGNIGPTAVGEGEHALKGDAIANFQLCLGIHLPKSLKWPLDPISWTSLCLRHLRISVLRDHFGTGSGWKA